ncbi:hypothetical protein EMIHUDRAFT_109642 [Emiliania huxleyi CCMP1516]|uniref:Uncharacterized protein n=2 Tax=Emiliania huxleyi TaxID=2903 RepID=A0A0D3KPB6_EMIH1|nr:hypothetical protein EMIHUDRAFT_109642 [Emiliania huxleyi CCMP1516]EOD37601.1 hypothetical protein EMIHUDRAFT_109642 [Emiliania huxleyi CCMP1516]|eukprot:XP_005790030.1 hypothetical protein EMIHUDRAFT_109642 [Emiliania huxleyi CCMP1516]
MVSIQEGYHSFLGTKSDEKDGSILFKVKNENLVCNLPVLPNVYASGDVGGPLRLDVGCVKVLGNKLCPSCRAFGLTNADIIHDAQCAAQALKERRAAAANVAKKKTFESLIVDNKVEVARAAGKAKAMAARDGIGFCPAFNQTALPCKTAARCRYAPCVNFEALLHSAFKDTIYERMPSAVAAFGGPARRPLSERDPEVTDLDPFGRQAFIGLTPEQVAAFGGPQVRPLSYPPFDEPEAALKDLSSQLSDAVAANAKAVSELIAAGTALRLERDQVNTALAEVQQKKQLARQLRWRPAKAATASGGGVKATDDGVGGLLAAAAAAAALFFAANPA